jgi:hypothetical protein
MTGVSEIVGGGGVENGWCHEEGYNIPHVTCNVSILCREVWGCCNHRVSEIVGGGGVENGWCHEEGYTIPHVTCNTYNPIFDSDL